MYYSVDAIENGTARLIADDGKMVFVPQKDLPAGVLQTDILVHDGKKWQAAPQETLQRKKQAHERLQKILGR